MAFGSLAVMTLLLTAVLVPGLGDSEPVGSALSGRWLSGRTPWFFSPRGFSTAFEIVLVLRLRLAFVRVGVPGWNNLA